MQRPKNLGSRVALLPRKFLRVLLNWTVYKLSVQLKNIDCPLFGRKIFACYPESFGFLRLSCNCNCHVFASVFVFVFYFIFVCVFVFQFVRAGLLTQILLPHVAISQSEGQPPAPGHQTPLTLKKCHEVPHEGYYKCNMNIEIWQQPVSQLEQPKSSKIN